MKVVTAYKTQDGKIFESKEQALDHEFGHQMTASLDEFTASAYCPYPDGVANQQLRKSVVAWEKFKASNFSGVSIETLDLPVRTINCLKSGGIATIGELITYSSSDLLRIPNLGRKAQQETLEALRVRGLSLISDESSKH